MQAVEEPSWKFIKARVEWLMADKSKPTMIWSPPGRQFTCNPAWSRQVLAHPGHHYACELAR
jgi:hypothetical protein